MIRLQVSAPGRVGEPGGVPDVAARPAQCRAVVFIEGYV